MTGADPLALVVVPPSGESQPVHLNDRRSRRQWTVEVQPFAIGRVPVTESALGRSALDARHGDLPATEVSWRDAIVACNHLSTRHGLTAAYQLTPVPEKSAPRWAPHDRPAPDDLLVTWDQAATGFRLPTEAEWELACRAGTIGPRYGDLDQIAWHRGNSRESPQPVGRKTPNPWGLHDMLGGVWEWCWDQYDPAAYGSYRVLRGGGWFDEPWSCRAGVRRSSHPTLRIDDVGFRLAQSLTRD